MSDKHNCGSTEKMKEGRDGGKREAGAEDDKAASFKTGSLSPNPRKHPPGQGSWGTSALRQASPSGNQPHLRSRPGLLPSACGLLRLLGVRGPLG